MEELIKKKTLMRSKVEMPENTSPRRTVGKDEVKSKPMSDYLTTPRGSKNVDVRVENKY